MSYSIPLYNEYLYFNCTILFFAFVEEKLWICKTSGFRWLDCQKVLGISTKGKKKSTFLRESEIVIHLEMLTQKQEETSENILEYDRRTFHKWYLPFYLFTGSSREKDIYLNSQT